MTEKSEQKAEALTADLQDERTMLARAMDEYGDLSEQELVNAKALARHHITNFRVLIEACDRLIERHQNRRALAEAEAASKH